MDSYSHEWKRFKVTFIQKTGQDETKSFGLISLPSFFSQHNDHQTHASTCFPKKKSTSEWKVFHGLLSLL